ncbi:hypothetical protein BCV72DRAFT_310473 [Rhizopus microsporus var. microsporus]|uniref:Reverse transcriptase domain-containing protein n=1 Tax=Rhizopus microsporus var. microsporus TaxID=86635 RepID=A0A1X0QMI0_RHIZD|nr:hypothetical protein BCV72DRAFT_310473 [Rhizopus microsporus var. microsporus]
MSERFIDNNRFVLKLQVDQAKVRRHPGVNLLLDQEKAYDRLNPKYLVHVLVEFGFHDKFIQCIHYLFFGNSFQSISMGSSHLSSFNNRDDGKMWWQRLPRKALVYANDICTLLANAFDYTRLQYHLTKYSIASNAKVNQEKTEAFALSDRLSEP